MMNIKETIDQINYVMDEVEDTPEKYRQLHELGLADLSMSQDHMKTSTTKKNKP